MTEQNGNTYNVVNFSQRAEYRNALSTEGEMLEELSVVINKFENLTPAQIMGCLVLTQNAYAAHIARIMGD
jgi:hypothetical protein